MRSKDGTEWEGYLRANSANGAEESVRAQTAPTQQQAVTSQSQFYMCIGTCV